MLSTEVEAVYDSVHQQIMREEMLINNRLTWILVFHGLLFNVIPQSTGSQLDATLVGVLLIAIPLVGICTAVLGFSGICAAYSSIRAIKRTWEQVPSGSRDKKAPPYGGTWTHRFGMAPSVGIPLVLTAAWACIFWWLR